MSTTIKTIEHPEADGQVDELVDVLPKRSRYREVWVGLLVIAGVLATLTALFTLTDAGFFRGRYYVTTVVDNASGIRSGDPVQMRGVNIGRVRQFDMAPEGVAIRLEIEGEYDIPRDSRIVLSSKGLLGGVVAEVIPGTSPERADEDDMIPGTRTEGLFDTAGELGDEADRVMGQVQALLSDQTVDAIGESTTELRDLLRQLSAALPEQRRELEALMQSLRRSAAGLEQATSGPELERTIQRVDALTARLAETTSTLQRASASLETVLARMERGEGTLGRLSTDDELYVNLNRAAANVNALVEDLRANPRRYINLEIF